MLSLNHRKNELEMLKKPNSVSVFDSVLTHGRHTNNGNIDRQQKGGKKKVKANFQAEEMRAIEAERAEHL